jgi:hypothetical protein
VDIGAGFAYKHGESPTGLSTKEKINEIEESAEESCETPQGQEAGRTRTTERKYLAKFHKDTACIHTPGVVSRIV